MWKTDIPNLKEILPFEQERTTVLKEWPTLQNKAAVKNFLFHAPGQTPDNHKQFSSLRAGNLQQLVISPS